MPLFETFWIYYFAAVIVLQVVGSALGILGILFFLIALGWAGFMVRPISGWRPINILGPKHWAMLAKIMAILIVIGVVSAFSNCAKDNE